MTLVNTAAAMATIAKGASQPERRPAIPAMTIPRPRTASPAAIATATCCPATPAFGGVEDPHGREDGGAQHGQGRRRSRCLESAPRKGSGPQRSPAWSRCRWGRPASAPALAAALPVDWPDDAGELPARPRGGRLACGGRRSAAALGVARPRSGLEQVPARVGAGQEPPGADGEGDEAEEPGSLRPGRCRTRVLR